MKSAILSALVALALSAPTLAVSVWGQCGVSPSTSSRTFVAILNISAGYQLLWLDHVRRRLKLRGT